MKSVINSYSKLSFHPFELETFAKFNFYYVYNIQNKSMNNYYYIKSLKILPEIKSNQDNN